MTGYEGKDCQVNVDDCNPDPCNTISQFSQCIDGVDSFICDCEPGYEGLVCEVDTNECDNDPCNTVSTRSECIDGINSFT